MYRHRTNPQTVTGHVKDSAGKALQDVSVTVTSTRVGTLTDVNGNYSLNIPDKYTSKTLTFSFTGMLPQEVAVASNKTINTSLKMDFTKSLDDVVHQQKNEVPVHNLI